MINKKQFTKAAKQIFKHQRGLRDPHIIHPRREWLVGLLLAVLLFIGLAWWSYGTYTAYSDTSSIGAVTGLDGTVVYRESMVKDALSEFSARKAVLIELIENAPAAIPRVEEASTTEEAESAETDEPDDTNALQTDETPQADTNSAPATTPN